MKTVRDHKRFLNTLPHLTEDRLRGLIHVHETTEPITTSDDNPPSAPVFKTNATTIFISGEMLEDVAVMKQLSDRIFNDMARYWTTSEAVELAPHVTRDDAAAALWQAANRIHDQRRQITELEAKVARMQDTASAMFGDRDDEAIAELFGIRTEC